ncbi:siroheme synthase (plasmid) [Peteryoungia desertarenae]|uniref:precorrin-2 dehydrogenase n=1 Tax=Peteryoungia desertarenae TaxID=1813451 RepID=A0ABX6QTH7_9HYPH|nr:SAM-dependent methyltransferase [Peteryoungia desertarenae]QLF71899.1 siroheme synthase [Peteryoungia desertarenae]
MRTSRSPQNRQPLRSKIEPLAKLPVFWQLEGRRVVLAGGSDGAAWKAELLMACGAEVHLYCPDADVGEAMAELIAQRGGECGSLVHHSHVWHIGIFAGSAMALADCEEDEEAKAFYCAARAAGVPVNVIDKPRYCQFQFGSIVNRSPVIVSISTDGAAPILAQAIRRRIETLLPPSLKGWAELAQRLREQINDMLDPGPGRRAFWERFVDYAFSSNGPPDEDMKDILIEDAMDLSKSALAGRLIIVGTGPGDAALLTLKAVRALQQADVILHDRMIAKEVLELSRREARRLMIEQGPSDGKLEEIVTDLVRDGRTVAWLVAGDPRHEQPALSLRQSLSSLGVDVDMVAGVARLADSGSTPLPVPATEFGRVQPTTPLRPDQWQQAVSRH